MLETIGVVATALTAFAAVVALCVRVWTLWREHWPSIAIESVEVTSGPVVFSVSNDGRGSYGDPTDRPFGSLEVTLVNRGKPVTISSVTMIDLTVNEKANQEQMNADEAGRGRLDTGAPAKFSLHLPERESFTGPVRFLVAVAGHGRFRSTTWRARRNMADDPPPVVLRWHWRGTRPVRRAAGLARGARWRVVELRRRFAVTGRDRRPPDDPPAT